MSYVEKAGRWLALGALAACNSVTGASGIEFVDGAGGQTGSSTTNGATTVAATTAASTGGGASAATGASAGATASTGATAVASSSSTGSACVYPDGPYGVSTGKVIPPTLNWKDGYPAGAFDQGTLSSQELFDCDGSKGINAILFDTSQFG